jgi:hypothetical protein
MSYLFRLKLFSFLILTNSIVFLGQSGFRTCKMSDLVVSEAQGKRILKYKDDVFETSEEQVKILIFVDTSNVLLKGGLLLSELDILKEAINSSSLSSKSCFYIIKGQSPRVGGNYFEFPKKDFAISDFPVYILHSSRIENLVFDAYAQFSYVGEYINGKNIIRFLPPESSCGKYNFLRPLHGELIRIAEQLESQPIQTKIVGNNDFSNYLNEMNNGFGFLREELKKLSKDIQKVNDRFDQGEDYKFRIGASGRIADDFSAVLIEGCYEIKGSNEKERLFTLGFESSTFNYHRMIDRMDFQSSNKLIQVSDLSERGSLNIGSLKFGLEEIWKLRESDFQIHCGVNFGLNQIKTSDFSWSSGVMNVRGKLIGIEDEIINVPELGFQDGVSLYGINGKAQFNQFFSSVDLDLTIHYNLEKFDFFAGGGYMLSEKIRLAQNNSVLFDGQNYNSLLTITNPLFIRTPFVTIGMNLIF